MSRSSNYLEFVNKRNKYIVAEGFSEKNIEKLESQLNKILKKHIPGLIPLIGFVEVNDGENIFLSKQYIQIGKKPGEEKVFQINWLKTSDKLDAYSIDFFDDATILFDYKAKSSLTIYTLGSSIIYFLPIIWTIIETGDYNLSQGEAIALGKQIFKDPKVKESFCMINNISYHIITGLSTQQINEAFLIHEASISPEVQQYARYKKEELNQSFTKRRESAEDWEEYLQLRDEYNEIKTAIRDGASTIEDLNVALKKNVKINVEMDNSTKEAEKKFTVKTMDPEEIFKMMTSYVKMVIKGINPSVILCGAPGVGKTYRIKKVLKDNNYNEGQNLFTIKGKCSPRALYTALYAYKDKGDIIVIDDADGLVGPKAPEECINILKGALDSTSDAEGRLISYGIAGKILDDDGMELPKRFYYNGGIIVITNYNAGSLDTALRGRSFIQDIHFTTEELLKIIKDIMPAIDPEHLTNASKIKAYDYMNELVEEKAEMEVSIRTFRICAQIFESLDDGDSEETAKYMIKEQLRLQAMRTKNQKY